MTHFILGSGPVGLATAAALVKRKQLVVLVSRTPPPAMPAGVRHVAGDVRHSALGAECKGASVVYQCLNAPYHRWREEFPDLQRAAVDIARAENARYVSFENVYMYGAPSQVPFPETSIHSPCSDKGRVRAAMADDLQHMHAAGDLDVVQVRASDLFGPGMRGSALGEEIIGRAVAGKGARGFGDLDAPHTWTFTLDAGETLAVAGLSQPSSGRVWHVPSDSPRSQREVVAEISRQLSRPVDLSATPSWLLRIVGLFRPEAKALIEMKYEFANAFLVDDRATRASLGVTHTPFREALGATIRWYQQEVKR